jgi:hypothetical protein
MVVGAVCYRRVYSFQDYASVSLITLGIALFSVSKTNTPAIDNEAQVSEWHHLLGLLLVCCNLMLDGFTNQEQDRINKV